MTKSLLPERIKNGRNSRGYAHPILCTAMLLGALFAASPAHAQAPQLSSVTPPNGTTNAPVNSSLVFVFDQPMDTDVFVTPSFPPFLVGNLEVTPASHYITGTWSDDGRTLTCPALSPLPAGTDVTWRLNPAGGSSPLTSAGSTELATVTGSFRTAGGGGTNECDQTGLPLGWGNYSVTKNITYEQSSTANPVTDTNSFLFGAFVRSPTNGPAVTAGSITVPNTAPQDLEGFFGTFSFTDFPLTEDALNASYPGGTYTLQFTQTGQAERVITMSMPAVGPPVPKIANFDAAQDVDAVQDFTLSWGAFTGAGANDFINLVISDNLGVVFQAPDFCVPRTLPVTATSILIPANTLKTNQTYMATLSFSHLFYNSTNAVPQMAGYGNFLRSTSFTIDTGSGGPGLPGPASLTGSRVLPNGNPEIDLTGTPSRLYTIQRTGDLGNPNWTTAGTATMDVSGNAVFQDTQPNKTFPLFYRAVGN